jgi:hypothetical protein
LTFLAFINPRIRHGMYGTLYEFFQKRPKISAHVKDFSFRYNRLSKGLSGKILSDIIR